jgi:hypothetical protein
VLRHGATDVARLCGRDTVSACSRYSWTGALAAWDTTDRMWRPVLLQDGWELDEVLAGFADDGVSAEDVLRAS